MQRRILHIDMDAFFASIEILDQPELAGKPVLVGGTGARGVVAASSYEARKFGIHSAMPMNRARELCPRAIIIRPPHRTIQPKSPMRYSLTWRKLSPLSKEPPSTRAILISAKRPPTTSRPCASAKPSRGKFSAVSALPSSVGIAPCKFIAKIASDLQKPNAPRSGSRGKSRPNSLALSTWSASLESERYALANSAQTACEPLPTFGASPHKCCNRCLGNGAFAFTISPTESICGRWVTEHERKSYGAEMTF